MTFNTFVALACVVWLLSCGASLLALYWNIKARSQRPRAASILSCAALLLAYGGLSRVQLSASKTVNGELMWSFNSRWFFIGAVVLGGASLAWSLWNWVKAKNVSAAGLSRSLSIVFFLACTAAWAGDFGFPSEQPPLRPVENPSFNLFNDFQSRLQSAINSHSAAAFLPLYQTNDATAQQLTAEIARWEQLIGNGTNILGMMYKELNTLPSEEARKIWTAEAHHFTDHEVTHLAFVRVNGVSLTLPLVLVDKKLLILPSEKIAAKATEPQSGTPPQH